jgi:hypothetical protein
MISLGRTGTQAYYSLESAISAFNTVADKAGLGKCLL